MPHFASTLAIPPKICLLLFLLSACAAAPVGAQGVTLAAAGDVACEPSASRFDESGVVGGGRTCQMKATADLILERNPDAVLTLGDNQYQDGELSAFAASYGPTWGRFKAITYPVPGNHDYRTDGASGYYGYFGDRAGDPAKGYYSFDLGDWHLIALNSNCDEVGGCGEGSAQLKWLEQDLADNAGACTLAYWHHPRFSSGNHGSDDTYNAFWQALIDAGAELVLSGHDHSYERFAPQRADASAGDAGVRQFVVGTGGIGFYARESEEPNSEAFVAERFGALFLTLSENGYDWSFVGTDGETLDAGKEGCH